jgi:hypothetical protein
MVPTTSASVSSPITDKHLNDNPSASSSASSSEILSSYCPFSKLAIPNKQNPELLSSQPQTPPNAKFLLHLHHPPIPLSCLLSCLLSFSSFFFTICLFLSHKPTDPQLPLPHKTKTVWVLFLFSLLYSSQNFSHPIANKQEEEDIQQTTTTKQKTTQKGMHFTSNFFIHKKRLDSSDFYAGKQTQLSSPSHQSPFPPSLSLSLISFSLFLSVCDVSLSLSVLCDLYLHKNLIRVMTQK